MIPPPNMREMPTIILKSPAVIRITPTIVASETTTFPNISTIFEIGFKRVKSCIAFVF